MASQGGSKGISLKKATIVVCSINLVVALYVLHSLSAFFYVFYGAGNAASMPFGAGKYTDEQIRKMNESMQIRQAAEPVELVKLVKEMENEFSAGKRVLELSSAVKRVITNEVLEQLKQLQPNSNVSSQRACLDIWRKHKLQELRRWTHENLTSNSSMTAKESNMLAGILESDWILLMEHIGLWLPPEIIHQENDDKPANEVIEEEDIIPGPPIPAECRAEIHTDYDGAAVRWGLTHHKDSAADCCQACLDQAKLVKPGEMKCNIWVYCPSEAGCFSPDKYEHKNGECWLKQAVKPRLNFKHKYSDSYRSSHPTAPLVVPWISGVVVV